MELFRTEKVTERIIRIIDIFNTASYLVIGEKRACLIDTCNGVGNIKEFVESIISLPYDVVLTHGHFDHAGGCSLFEKVYINEKDVKIYYDYFNHPLKQQFINTLPKELTKLINEQRKQPFSFIKDQYKFKLGGISVEMIEVEGHTPGMMMALIPEEKIILFGDACGESVLIFDDYSSTIKEYKDSLLKIKKNYSKRYNKVIRNHGTFVSEVNILDNVIECCDDILNHRDDHIPLNDPLSENCFIAKEINEKKERIDGKHGNIVYRIDKVNT